MYVVILGSIEYGVRTVHGPFGNMKKAHKWISEIESEHKTTTFSVKPIRDLEGNFQSDLETIY